MHYLDITELLLERTVLYRLFRMFLRLLHLIITQFSDRLTPFPDRFTSQWIGAILRILQKLLKYFNGTAVSTSLVLPAAGVLPIILALNYNFIRICYVIICIIFIILSETSWRFCSILMAVFYEVIDQYHNMQVFGIIYLRIVYFVYVVSKCFTIF